MSADMFWRRSGAIWPLGIPTSLSWYDIGGLLYVIGATNPGLVLEIGIQYGGLAALLASYAHYTGIRYRGIDCAIEQVHRAVWESDKAWMQERDAWDGETVAEVRAWIEDAKAPALIICDGGDKPKDLHTYAWICRPGDIIMAHDYGKEYDPGQIADLLSILHMWHDRWLDDTTWCVFTRKRDR